MLSPTRIYTEGVIVMEIEPKMILEYGAYGVMLYLFIMLVKFLCKDLRDDLSEMTSQLKENRAIIKEDADNTKELKKTITNHLVTSVNKWGEKIEKLGEKIEKL